MIGRLTLWRPDCRFFSGFEFLNRRGIRGTRAVDQGTITPCPERFDYIVLSIRCHDFPIKYFRKNMSRLFRVGDGPEPWRV